MAIPAHLRDQVDQFMAAIAPLREAYEGLASFSFIATQNDGVEEIIRGTLYLNVTPPIIPVGYFRTHTISAGHFFLRDLPTSIEEFLEGVFKGLIATPVGELVFSGNDAGNHGARFNPFHEIGLQNQRRLAMLTVFGRENQSALPQPHLDWELRASATPFDGINELLAEYQPGALYGISSVDIAAMAVVAVDVSSMVRESEATINLRKTVPARSDKITVGYRQIYHGKTVKRGHINNADIQWIDAENGTVKIEVTAGTVLHAIASYAGIAQHHHYIADPSFFQNSRRAVFEAFDPKLEILGGVLARAQTAKADGRAFEALVSWVAWMLGFSPAHLSSPYSEMPDVLLAAPSGNLAVVECTTGIFDAAKLGRLNARTLAARAALVSSKMAHLKVLPLLVASLSREEAKVGIDEAKKLGILVLTREDIDDVIQRSILWPNPDQILEQGFQAIVTQQLSLVQPDLPVV